MERTEQNEQPEYATDMYARSGNEDPFVFE
jgi:hypothetical protein